MTEQEVIATLECCASIPQAKAILDLINAKQAEVERLMQIIESHRYTATERDEALKELEYLKKNAVTLPHRIGTTIIDRDEHGEYYMIQCATEQAAYRRMENRTP